MVQLEHTLAPAVRHPLMQTIYRHLPLKLTPAQQSFASNVWILHGPEQSKSPSHPICHGLTSPRPQSYPPAPWVLCHAQLCSGAIFSLLAKSRGRSAHLTPSAQSNSVRSCSAKPASAQRDNYLSSPGAGPQTLQLKASQKSSLISQACRSLPSLQGQHSIHHTHTDQEGRRQLPKVSPATRSHF